MKNKGEIWITNSRKGRLKIELLEDVDDTQDDFFQARIVEGTATYLTREPQEEGETISMRTTLTRWIKKMGN